jgi:2-amino-4-hydroxy-6-hydroxymethyldihydropteridine diphosphokinase
MIKEQLKKIEIGTVIKQDTSENQVKSIYLGIGSNLGDKKKNIEKAKFELIKENIKIIKSSNYYESLSWPNPNNPKFLNIVLQIETNLTPYNLMKKCKEIEINLGRVKSIKNSPRICDIDIIDYNKVIEKSNIILPHPRMHSRNFVLLPLFEINKDWKHPILKLHIKNLILSLPNRDIRSIKQI